MPQILVPDLLGCGKSPRPVDSLYTLEEQVESIHKSVLERHNVDSFHIVSHSMGTVVALALAARFPDRVRSLTLIAPLYGGTGEADGVDPQLPTCDTIMALTKPWTVMTSLSQPAMITFQYHPSWNTIFACC